MTTALLHERFPILLRRIEIEMQKSEYVSETRCKSKYIVLQYDIYLYLYIDLSKGVDTQCLRRIIS
jgi:hypothetical protein